MKVTGRITFVKWANREFLVQAFFDQREYSPKNVLCIMGDQTAFIQLEYDKNPPQGIIRAISHCKINVLDTREECKLQDLIEEYKNSHKSILEEDCTCESDESAEEDVLTESGEENQFTETEIHSCNYENPVETDVTTTDDMCVNEEFAGDNKIAKRKQRKGKAIPSEDDYLDSPVFDEYAQKATTFPGFVTAISNWLNLSADDASYFFALVMKLSKIEQKGYELRFKQVKEANMELGESDYRRVKLSKFITPRLQKDLHIDGTLLPLLATVLKYKDSCTKHMIGDVGEKSASNEVEEDAKCQVDVQEVESTVPSTAVENELAENPVFAGYLANIDRDAAMSDQVSNLLTMMGLNEHSGLLFKTAVELILAALEMENIDSIDSVMEKAGFDVGTKRGMQMKIKFAEWINSFNKAHHIKRMKAVTFIRNIKDVLFTK